MEEGGEYPEKKRLYNYQGRVQVFLGARRKIVWIKLEVVRYAKEQEAEGIPFTPCWPGFAFWAYMTLEEGDKEKI